MMSASVSSSGFLPITPPLPSEVMFASSLFPAPPTRRAPLRRLDEDGDALSTPDARRSEPELAPAPSQLIEQVRGDAGPRGAQWMAERDGATVDVGALAVE